MVTAAGTTPDGEDRELTVDQLALRAGVTVRNVRAYSARGLLPPPRMVGRTGYYGREHVARLLLVREMLAEGYTLAMIERTLTAAPPTGSSVTLALHRALLAPWLPPEPELTTGGDRRDPGDGGPAATGRRAGAAGSLSNGDGRRRAGRRRGSAQSTGGVLGRSGRRPRMSS